MVDVFQLMKKVWEKAVAEGLVAEVIDRESFQLFDETPEGVFRIKSPKRELRLFFWKNELIIDKKLNAESEHEMLLNANLDLEPSFIDPFTELIIAYAKG